jgi:hypothetical protein
MGNPEATVPQNADVPLPRFKKWCDIKKRLTTFIPSLLIILLIIVFGCFCCWRLWYGSKKNIENIDSQQFLRNLQSGMPLTHQKLIDALDMYQMPSRSYALSIHLFDDAVGVDDEIIEGDAQAKKTLKHKSVEVLFSSPPSGCDKSQHKIHPIEAVTQGAILNEIAKTGIKYPCTVFVWYDIEQIPYDERAVLKSLFDENPISLIGEGGKFVDLKRMTFIILTHKTPCQLLEKLASTPDPVSAMDELDLVAHEDIREFHLWPDRISHVIRYHIPFTKLPKNDTHI